MPRRVSRSFAPSAATLLLTLLTMLGAAALARAPDDAGAESRTVAPATWGSAAALFDERMEVPSPFPRALLFVRCFAVVGQDGTIARVACNPNRDDRAYSERLGLAVGAAAEGLRIEPAVVDGRTVPLRRFPFSVMVAPIPDDPLGRPVTKVVANHLLEAASYGVDYTAPQEVFTDVDTDVCRTSRELAFVYTVRISAKGEAGPITLSDESARAPCEAGLRRYLDTSVFIPATHEDRFVDALFLDTVTVD